jgi:hypothetical protein
MTACKDAPRPDRAVAAPTHAETLKVDDPPVGAIDLRNGPYREASLTSVGSVSGTIRSAEMDTATTDSTSTDADSTETAADSLTSNPPEAPDCQQPTGPSLGKNRPFAGSIVWIAGVKAGKPLPIEKRADLSSEKCLLDPRVQAVVVGTTLNVINDEKVLHKLIFTKLGTRDTLAVTPFFNSGQMVATERLAKTAGVVEVRCARHPWTRAYIAVFDHPYFAATERNGRFKIDSLPPGSYTLMIWSPGDAKPAERQIQVTAGGDTRVDVK